MHVTSVDYLAAGTKINVTASKKKNAKILLLKIATFTAQLRYLINSSPLMEPEGSLQCSQEPATGTFP
jgi:hypothetical protein